MMPQTTALLETFNQQRAQVRKTATYSSLHWPTDDEAEGLDQAWENACQPAAFGARLSCVAPVAQGIEQRIPNPCAASSILAGGTIFQRHMTLYCPPPNSDWLPARPAFQLRALHLEIFA